MSDEKKVVDNKDESTTSKDRRSVLKSVVAGSAVVTGSAALPEKWSKPLTNAVILPGHAETTDTAASAGDYSSDNFYIQNQASSDYAPAGPGDYLSIGDPDDANGID